MLFNHYVKRRLLSAALITVMLAAVPSPASATITDYSSYTYTWTDAQGVQHTSNLAEVATSIPQMKAMIY